MTLLGLNGGRRSRTASSTPTIKSPRRSPCATATVIEVLATAATRIDKRDVCRPASFRSIRGGTACAAICDEVSVWRSDTTSNPDSEVLSALRPCLATTGGLLACISSPYARKGELWNTVKRDFGPGGDPLILVAKAPSRTMNGTLTQKFVDRQYERDAASARAEYGAEFRTDIESFVTIEAVEACVETGRIERPYLSGRR